MPTEKPTDLLSRSEIEELTGGGITRRWLELAAHRGEGPPMLKISRGMVRYRRADFLAWLERHVVNAAPAGE
jgi:predicted DNA-binding transcriptional regulator AlpA